MLLSRVDGNMLIASTSPYSGETRKKYAILSGLILDCWTEVQEFKEIWAIRKYA